LVDYPIVSGLQYNANSLFGDPPQRAPYRLIEWVKHDDFPKENFLGIRCYHFATQLLNIRRDETGRCGFSGAENPNK
jgi:hypothetical protein